jgi:hypothetical protein
MRNPAPYVDWTTTTTGPVWVWFLAILGWLGWPLTLTGAHVLSLVIAGFLGGSFAILAARRMAWPAAIGLVALLWMPAGSALSLPRNEDMAALSTELLPAALVVGVALIRPEWVARRPGLMWFVGVLLGLAVLAKYQVVPIAVVVGLIYAVNAGSTTRDRWLLMARGAGGAIVVVVAIAVGILVNPQSNLDLIRQNIAFLTGYGASDWVDKWVTSSGLFLGSAITVVAMVIAFGVALGSPFRWAWQTAGLAAAGVLTVVAPGNGFGHYLWFAWLGAWLAVTVPGGERTSPLHVGAKRHPLLALGATVTLMLVLLTPVAQGAVNRPLSDGLGVGVDGPPPDASLASVCPPGSDVLVWGWAAELYVAYNWFSAMPYTNSAQIREHGPNLRAGQDMALAAVKDPDTVCVLDVSAPEYFDGPNFLDLDEYSPEAGEVLQRDFAQRGLLGCEECVVWVRRGESTT